MKKPSKIVTKVYQEHLALFGEPSSSLKFKTPAGNDLDRCPGYIEVLVWSPDEELSMTTFATIGMSDKTIGDSEHRAELHFAVHDKLDDQMTDKISQFMAEVALSPFVSNTQADWWKILPDLQVPGFPSASCVLFHPAFVKDGWDLIESGERQVKILNLVPLTKEEFTISQEKDLTAMLNHMYDNKINFFKPR